MNHAYLLTGTNMGDREHYLNQAIDLIREHCGILLKVSSVYETAAWGKNDQPSFLNQALMLETTLNGRQLIRKILKIEKLMGRVRMEKYGPRNIDIDILLFNNEEINLPFLKVPHPELAKRRFALTPLAEIAGSLVHPVLHQSVEALLKDCPDQLAVKKYS